MKIERCSACSGTGRIYHAMDGLPWFPPKTTTVVVTDPQEIRNAAYELMNYETKEDRDRVLGLVELVEHATALLESRIPLGTNAEPRVSVRY